MMTREAVIDRILTDYLAQRLSSGEAAAALVAAGLDRRAAAQAVNAADVASVTGAWPPAVPVMGHAS